jgi:uncharacterized membrane protein YhhN
VLPWILLTLAATAALVFSVWMDRWSWRAVTKTTASVGFIGAAVAADAPGSSYGIAVLAALALCLVGDVLLLGSDKRAFLAGLGSFLAGHLAYVVAFSVRGLSPLAVAGALLPLGAMAAAVWRWLSPHLPAKMRIPVAAYVTVITLMVAAAVGCAAAGGPWPIPLGATLFFVSDLFVARMRFVKAELLNRAVGLPLYYTAQLLLAYSVTL